MPYAIIRFQKCKAGGVTARYAHDERKKESYKSNPDIDASRKPDNYHLVLPKQTYRREVQRMIKAAGCKTRKDSTVMVETLITASPEFLHSLEPTEQREFFTRALSFIESKVGRENIISAVVHMDERTPHMHLSFCPITLDKRLSAKTILGNPAKLSRWQTDYHAAMSERWPELERGISSQITKRKHIPIWLYKAAERLDKQAAGIEGALVNINPLNAKKQREKALALLERWLPEAERFTAQIKTVDNHIKSLERSASDADKRARDAENTAGSRVDHAVGHAVARMQGEIDDRDKQLREMYQEAQKLRRTIYNQETLIGKIPFELRDKLINQIKNKMERGKSR